MDTFFVDTNYWAALLNPGDHWHKQAIEVTESLGDFTVVTSELVLIELLNHVAGTHAGIRLSATTFVRSLRGRSDVRLVTTSTAQFQSALALYEKSTDKQWSLVDCASFLIMRQHRIRDALTHDRHFQQAGFNALLR